MVHTPPGETLQIKVPSQTETVTPAGKRFVLAHFSDPHLATRESIRWRDLLNKRMWGYVGWKLHRGAEHREGILAVLKNELQQIPPDHIAVTGDLTHLGLPSEFKRSRRWLETIGPPTLVTVVPGNHDAYVRADWHRTFALWSDYMASDRQYRRRGPATGLGDLFPVIRVRGRIVLIGVSTAHPNPLHLATGSIGERQLKRLETLLKQTAGRHYFRIIMIHHPPVSGIVSRRKRLTDAARLWGLIARYGTELILHGHSHKTTHRVVHSPAGSTTVVGAPSATSLSRIQNRRARFFIYGILRSDGGWEVNIAERIYSPKADRFLPEREHHFCTPGPGD